MARGLQSPEQLPAKEPIAVQRVRRTALALHSFTTPAALLRYPPPMSGAGPGTRYRKETEMNRIALALGIATLAAAPAAAVETLIFETGFETGAFDNIGSFAADAPTLTLNGASIVGSQSLPGFGSKFLRNPQKTPAGPTTFSVTSLGAHDGLRLQFDLAFLDSWDGNGNNPYGPDLLTLSINGTDVVFSSNNAQGIAEYGAGTIAAQGQFGFNKSWTDSIVSYDLLLPFSGDDFTFAIKAGGPGWQGGNDESWGIDNVRLSAMSAAVPEPATWALLIAGFGLVGATARRRRAHAGTARVSA